MTARILLAALGLTIVFAAGALSSEGWAAEPPGGRPGALPKGSYKDTCTCKVSGGVELSCFCANIQAKWFRTVMDVRQCAAPQDIKNCEGVLTCTTNAGAQCPVKN